MRLNALERLAMNNPVRRWVQHHVEATRFERMGGRLDGARVLEVGCGRGVGIEVLLTRLGAAEVHALDFDPVMVELASARAKSAEWGHCAFVSVADASVLPFRDGSFDAVVDFGIVHHVLDWRAAVAEMLRVVRPGGRVFFEEVPKELLDGVLLSTLFEHPRKDRFTRADFESEMQRHGGSVVAVERLPFSGGIFLGVAVRRRN